MNSLYEIMICDKQCCSNLCECIRVMIHAFVLRIPT